MSVAFVIYVWRPFVQRLYTAVRAPDSKTPTGCGWTKQIVHTLFLHRQALGENLHCRLTDELDLVLSSHGTRIFTELSVTLQVRDSSR